MVLGAMALVFLLQLFPTRNFSLLPWTPGPDYRGDIEIKFGGLEIGCIFTSIIRSSRSMSLGRRSMVFSQRGLVKAGSPVVSAATNPVICSVDHQILQEKAGAEVRRYGSKFRTTVAQGYDVVKIVRPNN